MREILNRIVLFNTFILAFGVQIFGQSKVVLESRASYPPILLDPFEKYTVSWEIDLVEEIVTFNVLVETQGYVGFGISKEGTMLGADIVVAEVEVTGEIIFTDFYGKDDQVRPTEDTQQDWSLESSSRNETHTHLVFSRAYNTGDTEGDVIIQDEDTYFIWAISRNDNPELNEYHGSAANGARGSYKINILNPAAVTELPTTEPATTEDSVEEYPQIVLDPFGKYLLSWEVNKATETVTFHLEVETQGYVGFGISTEGTMAGADIVAATIGDSGEISMNDYHGGTGQIEPIVDDQQDWTWLSSGRNGTHTSLSFSRKFDTQDTIGDVLIEDEETYIIWAISRNDNPELSYHGNAANGARGAYKVNILNPGAITGAPATLTTEEPSVTTPEVPATSNTPTTPEVPTTTEDPSPIYPPIVLDPFGRFILKLEVDKPIELVRFTLEVETQGYVGFGISKAGTMEGSDMVIATIGDSGEILFNDYHGIGQVKPVLDDQQDWTLTSSSRNGTHTSLSFLRAFDTGDELGDIAIEDEDTFLIWAISRTDSPDLIYHGSEANGARGAYKINILNPGLATQTPTNTEPAITTIEYTETEPSITESTTLVVPTTNITCDFQDILVHPLPAPCYVEFFCFNHAESIIVNSCEFINFDPRAASNIVESKVSVTDNIACDFKEILVHPLPPPCRVEFLCYNMEEMIFVNNCEFVDF